jgi:anion-transporting  ArsA/GET3 family ATPase
VAILDAPATGHGLTLLSGAKSMATMTRVGPFHDLALTIAGFLADADRTALLLTTLPEALPVHECIEAMAALERDDAHLAGLVLNRVRQNTMPSEPAWKDVAAALTAAGGPWANVVPIAALQLSRERAQSDAIDQLLDAVPASCPVVQTPWVDLPDAIARTRAVAAALQCA